MSEVKRVKIQNFIETQIPEFLNVGNPLFKEFLGQYYASLEHQTGAVDLSNNLNFYKSIENLNYETFISDSIPHNLTQDIESFDTTIIVSHTIGFPEKYGLLKIDNEIITYTSKTDTTFEGCIRGFSGIDNISTNNFSSKNFNFSTTDAESHISGTVVENLNVKFFKELFKKFRYQFIPGFENRDFYPGINLQTILSRAKDFYTSKGTDTSYKILFKLLFGEDIEIIKPRDYMLRPSDNNYFITKNILVERVLGDLDPTDLKGYTLYQNTPDGIASATIYNVELRPVENNKILYEISLDPSSFNLKFISTKSTKILEDTPFTSTTLLVDSTVGVSTSSLLINSVNAPSPFYINYTEKTINQFLGVSDIPVNLSVGDTVVENNFAYVNIDLNYVYFRILNIIDSVDYSNTFSMREEDKLSLSSFGVELDENSYFNNWIYNIPTTHKIKTINVTSQQNRKRIRLYDSVKFIKDESVYVYNSNNVDSIKRSANIVSIIDDSSVEIESVDNIDDIDTIQKIVTKCDVVNYQDANSLVSNVQNTYIDTTKENLYVTSSGLPEYKIFADDRKVIISTPQNPDPISGVGKTTILNTSKTHRFYTGEKVWIDSSSNLGISTGSYFVTTIGNYLNSTQISLSYSNSDIFSKKYINVSYGSTGELVKEDYQYKILEHQKLLKRFPLSDENAIFDENIDKSTNNKPVGMLLNGVEIYSPTLYDENIYYGKLDNIEILSSGSGYDVINSSGINITDEVNGIVYGTGAKAHLILTGGLSEVKIINSGSGYDRNLRVSISGGNGTGAAIEPNIIKDRISSGFRGDGVGVNPTENSINFVAPHNFEDGEIIEYFPNSNIEIEYSDPIIRLVDGVETIIGGQIRKLSENSFYFAGLISDTKIKLYRTKEDAANKVNEINLTTSPSFGVHYFKSIEAKNKLTSLSVKNSGSGYSNKKVVIPSNDENYGTQNGINTTDYYIFAKSHSFKDKDLVVYSTTGTEITGLSTSTKYYVKTLDKDRFKLSIAGIGNSIIDKNYYEEKYVRITSLGSGLHTFSYPPIELTIEASLENSNGKLVLPQLEPVVLGSVESIFIESSGEKYGTPEIINFHRRPNIEIGNITSEAILKPLIIDGSIIDVQILNYGSGYGKDIDLVISGNGNFADLYPVVENGRVVSVNIINGGINYDKNTTITVRSRGTGAKFLANIFEWKINQVEKNKYFLQNSDEGILVPSKNQQDGLQFVHFYPPKVFRNKLGDNLNSSNQEVSTNISPILGWSYDGFPIYGPYSIVDGFIQRVKSSYKKDVESNPNLRPSGNMISDGFFIQDYVYDSAIGDLDQYNGKFIKNSDFPDGTYAYFFTIDVDITNNSIPKYPYIISDEFRNHYVSENYIPSFNQNIDLGNLGLIRNTAPYYLNSTTSQYGLIDYVQPKYNQDFIVKSIGSSGIDDVSIYEPGDGYKVGDVLNFVGFDGGSGVYASISKIKGKTIDSFNAGVTTDYTVSFSKIGNKIVGTSKTFLNILNNDLLVINNISNNLFKFIEGTKKVTVESKNVGLSTDIASIGITGDITTIYPSDVLGFEVEDFIKIDEEIFRILDIIAENSSLIVQRVSNPGIHTSGSANVTLLPRKFSFFENSSTLTLLDNKTVYFNPENVVSIGSTIKSYTKVDSSIVQIPSKSIYLPNHQFKTGQPIRYNVGIGGTGLYVYDDITSTFQLIDDQVVYAVNLGKDFLGISTVGFSSAPNGIGNTSYSLFFTTPVSAIGIAHSFTTQYTEVLGEVENYFIDITTKNIHNLATGDFVDLSILPQIQKSIKFRYDSTIRKITTDKIEFDSSIIDLTNSEINIDTTNLKTGDKVVYYAEGNTEVGGLQDNSTYFVIVSNTGTIRLSQYYFDAINDINIDLSTSSSGTHSIAKINPKISITNGNYITFDMSDSTLVDIELKLFKDVKFTNELETYNYVLNSGERYLSTGSISYPKELYYSFNKVNRVIYPDDEVDNFNLIEIVDSDYNKKYPVTTINNYEFKLNLSGKPESTVYTATDLKDIYYTTDSKNVSGPIDKIKINSYGQGYKKLTKVVSIGTTTGKNAVVNSKSTSIGKISSLERVKDGFDYPTDETLVPSLSVPAVIQVEGISRVDYIGIVTGGINYNSKPTLKVIGNSDLVLDPVIDGTSIIDVKIISNVNNLSEPLRVVPTRNSNGYSINDITVAGDSVTLELLNSDNQIYPLITAGYGSTEIVFPFSIGDEIFIERCRISLDEVDESGNIIIRDNYNSSDYNYRFFTVTGVSTENYTVTYSVEGITNNLGNYLPDFGYGYVINRKDMAEFEMILANDLSYSSGEQVFGYNSNGTNTFSAKVMENGWDNENNLLRVGDVKGTLEIGDSLSGTVSLLNGIVRDVSIFNLGTKIGVTRDKLNDLGDRVGFLNDFQQRISDNDYYQKFSYSIQGKVPYNIWKESVRSIIHPSGFKEFSDLTIVGGSTANMKVAVAASLDLTVNIDNVQSLYKKNNFAMVTEEDQFDDGSIERVVFEDGVVLKPYILSKSNKVTLIDDISSQFDGTSNIQIIANKDVTFISTDLYNLGVSTSGLAVGDKIGFSTYHFYPDSTYILSIGENYIGISTDTPHRLYSVDGISTSVTQNLNFYRKIPGNVITGISTFKLTHNNYPLFYREFDASNGVTTTVNLSDNSFVIPEHNFHTGQKLIYTPQYSSYSAIASTSVGSGVILEPIFIGIGNSVSKINVISGGSGYDPINKPKIEIIGTKIPLLEGTFEPLISSPSGIITSINIINPGYGYFLDYTGEIGISTTTESEGRKDIIIEVGGGIGSAIYENGYNVAISGVSGVSSSIVPDFSGYQNRFWGWGEPYIPVKSTSGSGVDARFSVFIVYDSSTGSPISTSLVLRDGGRGYSVGDSVSIAGTYMGGATPTNDLSFTVSKVSSTRILSEANTNYSNIPADSTVGYGTGAILNISRDSLGDINSVDVIFGGSNYELTDNIAIAGTYIGGSTPGDDLYLSPLILGTDKLPTTVYVEKIDDNKFKLAGLSTAAILNLTSLGVGTHSFSVENPNENSIITIDNIIQTPIYPKNIELILSEDISYNDSTIYVNSGISTIVLNDILIINDEYMFVKNVSVASTNDIVVERAVLGSTKSVHKSGDSVFVSNGNYNIYGDTIHFASPPYGPSGPPGLEINSSFSGRAFSRRSDPFVQNNESIIFDDISDQFTGIATTEFVLKSNQSNVVGIYTNTNSITGSASGVDINNNPIILINNIPQIGGTDYIIDTPGQNTIRFISGVPLAGKITNVGFNTGLGYLPLVGASATVSVSAAGTISNVYITGFGKGYRSEPLVTIASTIGYGATITSTIGVGGTITSLSITSPGTGYTSTNLPEVRIDLPQNYYNLPLEYASGYSGIGTGAKASVIVGNGSSIISFNLDESGTAYKVGDVLVAPGISTDPQAGSFEEFRVTVLETYTDSFAGWYPGQFIQFDDISQYFNGSKKRFTLTITIQGEKQVLSLKSVQGISLTNNLFVYINDILQVPEESYTFTGTRIVFKEAPKVGSKCTILFFKGSDLDVEQVEPLPTIKEGDVIQIDENIFDPFDRPQFDRVVKDIFATDILDTFTYDSLGISTDPLKIRPLNWTKQTQDKVINGVLYSKSRPGLKSKIIPTAKVIKNISQTDQEIYVDSTIPLFSDLDETRGISEELRDIVILDNLPVEFPILNSIVSTSSTLSSIQIVSSGTGYLNNINPNVSISSRFITRKDPIYQWSPNVGLFDSRNLNSVGYGTAYVSVGDTGINFVSYDGENWNVGIETFSNINLNYVVGYGNTYFAIGDSGNIFRSIGLSTSSVWENIPLLDATKDILGRVTTNPSTYGGNLSKLVYNSTKDTLVAVGSSGGIFSAIGINTTAFYENLILLFDMNSIAYNSNYFVVVGQIGTILYSTDGQVWNNITRKATLQNLNDVLWDGSRFVSVGNNGTIVTSTDAINWTAIVVNNLSTNILKIYYNNGLYTILDSSNRIHFSLNLEDWDIRDSFDVDIFDMFASGIGDTEKYVSVGSSGFISYSTPTINEAVAISTTLNGGVSQITVLDGGFGYSLTNTTPVIVETEPSVTEFIYSVKAVGDYGKITNIEVFDTGNVGFGTTSPAILFTLKSENYPAVLPSMDYTQLQVGDYFTISDSNVICGHALTGITTSIGGMANYPASKVGTATSFIDGIYRVEGTTQAVLGISTVRCHFVPIPAIGADKIQVNIGSTTTEFYGRYSFGKIYDYQNRARENPKSFIVNKDNSLVGLSSGPMIYRTRGVI